MLSSLKSSNSQNGGGGWEDLRDDACDTKVLELEDDDGHDEGHTTSIKRPKALKRGALKESLETPTPRRLFSTNGKKKNQKVSPTKSPKICKKDTPKQ